ncbi:hypothetical protein ABZ636_40665 [Streptomyces sp. NPDC007251]|uniref:hypothetical protein n=1 Tax=unclassified Streptomyces TaxID=2593676 RepID=UPI0033FA7A41
MGSFAALSQKTSAEPHEQRNRQANEKDRTVTRNIDNLRPENGAIVPPEQIPTAVTAGRLAYGDGTTRTFQPDGNTSYFETGRQTEGTCSVDEKGASAPSGRPPTKRPTICAGWWKGEQSSAFGSPT